MKTLTELSQQAAFATPEAAADSLVYARSFTECFRAVEALPPGQREAAMLRHQFPAILHAPESGDLLAGRILYPVVGLSPEPMGPGWYFDSASVRSWMENPACSDTDRAAWEELDAFWQSRTTRAKIRAAMSADLSRKLPSDEWASDSGVGFPLYRMGGTTLDIAKLLRLGLDGLENEVAGISGGDFRQGALSALETLRGSIRWYTHQATDPAMRLCLKAIQHHPPTTLRQANQLFWLYVLHSGTWNYGRLDVALGPFLQRDLESGRLNHDQALALVCDLWLRMNDYSNQYNNRVWIGGRGRPDEAAADAFALLAIEATRNVKRNQPQLSLRFHPEQNPDLWERALDAIGEGCTFPMLYNDEVNIPALAEAFAVPEDLATEYTPFGCGEAVFSHHAMTSPNGVINLLKALEVALHGGADPLTGRVVTAGIPFPEAMTTFDDVWNAYARVVEEHTRALAEFQRLEYDVTAVECSFLYISMLTDACLERERPLLDGGVEHLGGTLETYGNTNAADSLHVIREQVFDQQTLSLPQLVDALDADFEGHANLQARCRAVAKYGNDEGTADAMACRVHEHVCRVTREQAKRVGLDSYLVVIINNWANTLLGHQTAASAEGRRAGEPMANGNNPTPGSDTTGVTAFLNSLVRLDPALHAGAVQNMKFSREWFGTNRPKFDALLRTYFHNGGTQAMVTVVSREDLESAVREPEKWGHLLVRVGGFSIRFVDLPPDAQRELIARTLH